MSTDAPAKSFTPSVSAVREHRARQQADRILDQFSERFTEQDYFPEEGDNLLFAMLTQMQHWAADTQIVVLDEDGDEVASYLKYDDAQIIEQTVTLKQREDGTYSGPDEKSATGSEALFNLIFSQLPTASELGSGGDFPNNNTIAGRIVTLRDQIAGLARANRAMLFEALLADAEATKNNPLNLPNPFLPFWTRSAADRSITLAMLHVLYPQMPVERLQDLLRGTPLTQAEEADLLHDETLPEAFAAALDISLKECTTHRAMDGLINTRTYDPQTDALARSLARRMLNGVDRELVILERDDVRDESVEPNDSQIVLRHAGDGEYLREDLWAEQIREPRKGTDSFYLNIIALLQPDERRLLLIRSEDDVAGFRQMLAALATADNGGWFTPEPPIGIENEFVPDWLEQASPGDKLAWRHAVQDYSQAMAEAQAPGLPDMEIYSGANEMRRYARERLRERLKVDHGLVLEPEEVFIETSHTEVNGPDAMDVEFAFVDSLERPEPITTTEVRNLVDLCLQNLAITDLNFLLSSRVLTKNGVPISQLAPGYIFSLVRDLNVGEDYSSFLRTRLLTSAQGQWSRERYAHVMQAQMRLDALEARLAGDYRDNGNLPPERRDRAYKWVEAVLDHPVDDDSRATVEGHKVAVGQVRVNGITLSGMLLIGVQSRQSVPSFVVYTPQAPGGKCFRELSSWDSLRDDIFLNADWLDYLVGLAPQVSQSEVRRALTVKLRSFILSPVLHAENFFEAAYNTQVERLIAAVDEQTTSTWEKNWQSAWEIVGFVGETALLFTPFKIALPIAALRSLYAVTQGLRSAANGEQKAAWYFYEAALVLADGLPGAKSSRLRTGMAKRPPILNIDPKKALSTAPDGLTLRTDGRYNGIYELSREGASSSFYVKEVGKTYSVRYDREFSTWRVVDPRRPDAYYQMPIIFKGSEWVHAKLGLLGGRPKNPKKTPKSEEVNTSGAAAGTQAGSGSARLFKLDVTGYKEDKIFKKLDQHIEDQLHKSIKTINEDFQLTGGGHHFHPVGKNEAKEKTFSFDIPGMPNDKGRGGWRFYVREPADMKGVLVHHKIEPWHKSKH